MPNSIIYLYQPSELIGTKKFKIGASNNQEEIMKKYPSSKYICILNLKDPCNFIKKNNIKQDLEGDANSIINYFIRLIK